MNNLVEYLPVLLPIILVELVLDIAAIVHIFKHPNYKFGNKIIWIILVLCIQIFGAVAYFIFGRGDE